VLGFVSVLAFGVLSAGVLAVIVSGGGKIGTAGELTAEHLDPVSLLLGLFLGWLLSVLARVPWTALPRRVLDWLLANERNFYRLAWGGVFIAILFFY
jgi:hypothetical protein